MRLIKRIRKWMYDRWIFRKGKEESFLWIGGFGFTGGLHVETKDWSYAIIWPYNQAYEPAKILAVGFTWKKDDVTLLPKVFNELTANEHRHRGLTWLGFYISRTDEGPKRLNDLEK